MSLGIGLMVLISGLECSLGWDRLLLYGRFGYVEMKKVFNDTNCSLLQIIYMCTSMLRLWSPFLRMENWDLFMEVCTRLEATVRDTFSKHGWLIRPFCITILYHNLLLFIDIFHI
jgi:hypothetical protein